MRKLLLGTAMSLAIVAGASAADLPPRPAPAPVYPQAPSYVAAYYWTGFYIGGNAGAAWGTFDPSTSTVYNPAGNYDLSSIQAFNAAGAQSIKPSGFTGGFEAGYNLQLGKFVFGLEGDIESFRLSGSATSGPVLYPCCAPNSFIVSSNASTSWLATARGRVGVAADNWLFFATGGAAFTTLNGNFSFSETFYGSTEAVSFANSKTGYTVGAGVEAGLWGNWTLKAEYLYVNLGTVSAIGINAAAGVPQPFTNSIDLKANIARVGLNYRF
jgi:outer membrane immunogenic protein